MKRLPFLALLALTLWPASSKLPVEIQLTYMETSLEVETARRALDVKLAKQAKVIDVATSLCGVPVKLVGYRLECTTVPPTAPLRTPLPAQLPASSISGGGK